MKRNIFFIILVLFSSVAVNGGFFYTRMHAATQEVVITELMYDPPGGDANHEWVELYNAGAEPVMLHGGSGTDGWRMFDGANHVFTTSTVLGAGAYMVIAQDSAQFLKDYPAFTGTLVESSFILDNASGRAALRVGSSGALWSEIQYTSAWGGGGNGYTLAKKHALGADIADEWAQSAALAGTPGAKNTFVEAGSVSATSTYAGSNQNFGSTLPVATGETTANPAASNLQSETTTTSSGNTTAPTALLINEIYPAPRTGEKEWIELYNPNSAAVDLTGWKLTDNSSTTTLYGAINAVRFVYWEFKGVLNNDGDIITLYRPDGSLADQIIYGDWRGSVLPAPENSQSLARFPDGAASGNPLHDFFLTTTPTRAGANKISAPLVSVKTIETSSAAPQSMSGGIVFSELMPNPTGPDDTPQGEFIELKNFATSTVDMSGWRIESGSQSYRIASGTFVGAGQFALLYRDTTGIFLPNEKGSVNMVDARGALVDRMKYENASAGTSINRVAADKWEWSMMATPGAENRVVPPNHPPEPVMSIEGDLFPGNQLWFDASDSWDADGDTLSFIWIFSDGVRTQGKWVTRTFGDTRTYKVTLVAIDTHKHARALTHQLKMNEVYDTHFAENASEEFASSTVDAENVVDVIRETIVSRSGANSPSQNKSLKVTTVGGALGLDVGARVSVQGVVVAAPGEFNVQTMYIAETDDMGTAVQIYLQKKTWPALKRGDTVQVEGEIGKAYGAARIKIKKSDDIEMMGHGASMEPARVVAADIPTTLGAALVSVEGTVVDEQGGGFALADESGQISLGLKRGLALPKGLAHLGDTARVIGIAVPAKNGMQILPRDARDIEITGRDTLVSAASAKYFLSSTIWVWLITICGVCVAGASWWWTRRRGIIKK